MPQNATIPRRGPIANCVLVLRDLKLSSQELHGTLHDVVARTGAAGRDAAVHDWRTYIERYEEAVSGASRAASQLRALIRTYLILLQQKRESTAEDMIVELSNLRGILETYHSNARELCESLRNDIATFYGHLTPDAVLENSSSIGICDRLVAEPEQLTSDAALHNVEHISKISPVDVSGTHVKTTMFWVLDVVFKLRLKKPQPRNRNGEPSTFSTGRRQSSGSLPVKAMGDSDKPHEKTPGKRRISLSPCGSLKDFDDSADVESTSQMQKSAVPSERPSFLTQGHCQRHEAAHKATPGIVDAARTVSIAEIRANQLHEETFRDLVKAIDSVLKELDRLAPRFDTYSELAQHLRNEITAYINAFSGYRTLQTLQKKNALEEMHARVEATSVHWTECLNALGEGLPRSSR